MSFSENDLQEYAAFAVRLADAARGQILPHFRNDADIFNKAGPWFDPVTDADRAAERVIREMIFKVYPNHGVIGEEFGETLGTGAWRWVLDPIDGTRAFICGSPTWATLIALEYDGKPVLGVIDQAYTDERWVGYAGALHFHRGGAKDACRTSGLTELDKARLATTDPRPAPVGYLNDEEARVFERVANATRVARFSMDAYAYALLANGEIDLVVESGLSHHDYAAFTPIVEGAGGVITNWSGEPVGFDERGETVAAATSALHEAALKVINDR